MLARNVLIFHSGALGDFVQTWPLGLALGRLYPQSRVIYVTQKQKGLLAEKVLRLEYMDVESGWHHLFGDAERLPEICRNRLSGAHSVFTFIAKQGDGWSEAVGSIARKAQVVWVGGGSARQMVESLGAVPAMAAAVRQILGSISDRGIQGFGGSGGGPIAIHPGAGAAQKRWPVDCYVELVRQLRESGHRCRIILGEVELEKWSGDEIRRLEGADEMVAPATYLDLLRELTMCGGFVGNDSGPGQLAGIIGLPSVILFGPSDPGIWKPLGPRVRVVRGKPLASVEARRVFEEVAGMLPQAVASGRTE